MRGETRLGVALGGGAARGLAHVGVLAELHDLGLAPDIVTGCSAGALTAAMYVTHGPDGLAELACSFSWLRSAWAVEFASVRRGPFDPARLVGRLRLPETRIEDLGGRLGVVATDLASGRERWLTRGALRPAVAASIALPGLFRPVWHEGGWLADGGLVDPLPVSLCRSLGATVVIAVSLGGDPWRRTAPTERPVAARRTCPSYAATVINGVTIMSEFIARVRLASDPPDILVLPDPGRVGLLDFHRGHEAIEAGRAALRRVEPALAKLLHHARSDPVALAS